MCWFPEIEILVFGIRVVLNFQLQEGFFEKNIQNEIPSVLEVQLNLFWLLMSFPE